MMRRLQQGLLLGLCALLISACGGPSAEQLAATATQQAAATAEAAGATTTALAAATAAARSAATARAATATAAVAQVAPTQTVIAAATEIAAVTENAATVFREEFVDNRNFWKLGASGDFETTALVDGTFEVSWNGAMSSSEFYEMAEFRNFLAETSCQVLQNVADGSCAMTFAWQSGIGYYRFELFDDYFRLFLQLQDAEPLILAEGAPQSAYLPAAYNTIRVLREAARIRVSVNDILLADVEDTQLFIGKVGISTASYSSTEPVVIRFERFEIATLGETP